MKKDTKFQPGTSGNAAGRPKNSGLGPKLRAAIASQSEELIQAILSQALQGDMVAAQILLDRVCPKLKPESVVTLDIDENGKKSEFIIDLLRAILGGEISLDHAGSVLEMVKARDLAITSEKWDF